jgi:energy-coupling factor transport system permease protein
VNFAPRYLGRGSWLARRDPRVLILSLVMFVFSVIQIWDLRMLLLLLGVAIAYYRSAAIPWQAVKLNWLYVFFFVGFVVTTNTLITGGQLSGYTADDLHVYFYLPIFGTAISAESVSYAFTQLVRFLAMAAMGFPIAFAIAPAALGATFARLRVPYKFAYGIELTFRFVPSLAADMRTTIDAQRIRGYEWEQIGRGPLGRIRRTVPLFVPVTINAIAGAEDTIDAMDLRAFGTGRRTWLTALRFDSMDRLVLLGFLGILGAATILGFAGFSQLWVPPFLISLAS